MGADDQPRSVIHDLRMPQRRNPYGYARNNPLRLGDPTGLIDEITVTARGSPCTWKVCIDQDLQIMT